MHALHTVVLAQLLGLAGDEIRHRHDVHVGHLLVHIDMRLGNPAGADDAHPHLLLGIDDDNILIFLKTVLQFCHNDPSSYFITDRMY